MNVSYDWLKELVNVPVSPEELADKVSRTGIEIDGVKHPDAGLKKIVVGKVLTSKPHPNSDHLKLCEVDVGEADPRQIVCGAPNVTAGQTVIVALPGARIADNVKIKKGKMRGEESLGMICALQEIGFNENVVPKSYLNGIYVFNEPLKPGSDALAALGMHDAILDFEITPNRADALGMRGVAWEVGATYAEKPHFVEKPLTEGTKPIADYLSAEVKDANDAPSYQLRVIDHVTVKESPLWLQRRLWNAGIRPINNIVDITNLIMLAYGQPLHAFDYAKLGSQYIEVRRAKNGEPLTTLDGREHELDDRDIVITNGQVPVALAGVMGGLNSEISEATTTVVVEAASFNPVNVRKTALKYNLRSEASSRFEKGINLADINHALDAAVAWMAELGGGQSAKGTLSPTAVEAKDVVVDISLDHINHVLGTDLQEDQVTGIFRQLGFGVTVADGLFAVAVPPRRWDIHIKADLVEEVARIYGFDNLPSTLPTTTMTIGEYTPKQKRIRRTRHLLEGLGLTQAITYGLTTAKAAEQFKLQPGKPTRVDSPMTTDHAVLRMNMVTGLLDVIKYNQARKETNVAIYEQGRIFTKTGDQVRPTEIEYLGGALTGQVTTKTWNQDARPVDFFYVKGIVTHLLEDYSLTEPVRFAATQAVAELHPGQAADVFVGDTRIGFLGRLHPAFEHDNHLPETFVFQLDLDALFVAPKQEKIAQPAPKFPAVTRDIALQVAETVTNAQVMDVFRQHGGAYLKQVKLFDVYAGEHIAEGQKSLAYTLTYRRDDQTLTEDEVTQAFDRVKSALASDLAAEIR
ncbi:MULTISPECIES: phenylalanine--tRNA ligase subunit beta [Lacticaseibacillus]|uniref:Phenylalanine--tRNA ligase beta subunit n=1 Tax=Lacticaseibacillus casei DSM 20011 = JCM 1134 = ATCC 393 TaxID=1423732 RepID=A0AAD1ETC0_LACCA|nr:phenylalanine--tRNA ligase subunit beta [Lacticaseibacillus casei]MBI6598878.1 phenylalanine--tRNA ligase subunit beta [Lacticaseibacillus casei]MBO1482548.1 phenylalanine--tRNA ligase subunit beta [Lacticaseibacillus casei]MBO2417833.1 phenylalanine--tRNA ligase subunit beta [Lacticaseibacillus casei]MCK2082221.1 phenylalanine--tRNA ligase subunit beta [Lacticaseibacillus casei]MDZ5495164.1 phenylalanine--tRNA ligase subunit beta [Lacticaseibacillus casei]